MDELKPTSPEDEFNPAMATARPPLDDKHWGAARGPSTLDTDAIGGGRRRSNYYQDGGLNGRVVERLWGISAAALGASSMGVSVAHWPSRPSQFREIERVACDQTHVVSVWIHGSAASELHLNGRKRFDAVRTPKNFQVTRPGEDVRALLRNVTGSCLDIYVPTYCLRRSLETVLGDRAARIELRPLGLERDDAITRAARTIAKEIRDPTIGSQLAIDGASLQILSSLIRNWSNISTPKQHKSSISPWQVRRTQEILRESNRRNVGLAELAEAISLSPFHFARGFKQATGLTPHKYHLNVRIEKAKELLASTTQHISEIAAAQGYEDPSYFSRLFNREVGLSPTEYRRQVI